MIINFFFRVNSESIKLRSDSCGTDSSTSGVSSSDSVYGKLPNLRYIFVDLKTF